MIKIYKKFSELLDAAAIAANFLTSSQKAALDAAHEPAADNPVATMADIVGGVSGVASVNGQTGTVVIGAGDVGAVASVVAGTNITVDNTDPANPVVSATVETGPTDITYTVDNSPVVPSDLGGSANPYIMGTNGENILVCSSYDVPIYIRCNPAITRQGRNTVIQVPGGGYTYFSPEGSNGYTPEEWPDTFPANGTVGIKIGHETLNYRSIIFDQTETGYIIFTKDLLSSKPYKEIDANNYTVNPLDYGKFLIITVANTSATPIILPTNIIGGKERISFIAATGETISTGLWFVCDNEIYWSETSSRNGANTNFPYFKWDTTFGDISHQFIEFTAREAEWYLSDATHKKWVLEYPIPIGGSLGQVLVKKSSANFDAGWVDASIITPTTAMPELPAIGQLRPYYTYDSAAGTYSGGLLLPNGTPIPMFRDIQGDV